MATKKGNLTKRVKSARLWPSNVTPGRALLMLSVMLNLALLVILWGVYSTNAFDKYVAKNGIEIYCSSEYRKDLNYEQQVSNDYACVRDDAKKYYVDGLNAFRATKSLEALPN